MGQGLQAARHDDSTCIVPVNLYRAVYVMAPTATNTPDRVAKDDEGVPKILASVASFMSTF